MADVMYTNAVYFLNQRIHRGDSPGMLNFSCVNHVYYAYASVGQDGGVFLSDEWADAHAPVDGVQGGLGSLMHLKTKNPHLHVVLSIGGQSSSKVFPAVAGNGLWRASFAHSALLLVEASCLDGIDISWDCPCDEKQGSDFLALLATVRSYLPGDRFLLTAALPARKTSLRFIDLKRAAEYLDYINLMAYDFFGPCSSKPGHHAQLYAMSKDETSGSSGVIYVMSHGFPAEKILLGVPTHSRSFFNDAGPGNPSQPGHESNGTLEYQQLPQAGCREVVDRRHVAARCVNGDGQVITYDNAETVTTKARFCKQKGLAGLFYWDATADSKEKSRSLVAAGFRALHTS